MATFFGAPIIAILAAILGVAATSGDDPYGNKWVVTRDGQAFICEDTHRTTTWVSNGRGSSFPVTSGSDGQKCDEIEYRGGV